VDAASHTNQQKASPTILGPYGRAKTQKGWQKVDRIVALKEISWTEL
jgi:hypothetical protein